MKWLPSKTISEMPEIVSMPPIPTNGADMPLSWRLVPPPEDAFDPTANAVELVPEAMAVVGPEAVFLVD
jgi:hypothetical protein